MRLALHALQAGLDHFPLRRVDHDRHARDVRLRRDQIQEADHRRLRIEHRLVHVDVDDLRAVLDLLARDGERLLELVVQDHSRERLRAGHVGALADVDEERPGRDVERLEAGEAHGVIGHGVCASRLLALSAAWSLDASVAIAAAGVQAAGSGGVAILGRPLTRLHFGERLRDRRDVLRRRAAAAAGDVHEARPARTP